MEVKQKQYIAIDLKSFYASVECIERGLDPMKTNLVVADVSRTEKTICLASEQLPAEQCLGRILAAPTVGCPPAVPILICGERIDAHALACFAYYGIDRCALVAAADGCFPIHP